MKGNKHTRRQARDNKYFTGYEQELPFDKPTNKPDTYKRKEVSNDPHAK